MTEPIAERLAGRIALITDGGTGIGAATARQLAREGAHVVLCGPRRARLDAAVRDIEEDGGSADAHPLDLTDECAFEQRISRTAAAQGGLDILVKVSPAFSTPLEAIDTQETEAWHASLRTTLDAVFFGLRAALPVMAKRGGGSIVNVGSTTRHVGRATAAGCVSGRAALEHITRCAAREAAPGGVRVNTVAPGAGLLPRFGLLDDVATRVVFVASDAAAHLSGACLVLDSDRPWSGSEGRHSCS